MIRGRCALDIPNNPLKKKILIDHPLLYTVSIASEPEGFSGDLPVDEEVAPRLVSALHEAGCRVPELHGHWGSVHVHFTCPESSSQPLSQIINSIIKGDRFEQFKPDPLASQVLDENSSWKVWKAKLGE